MDFFPTSWHHAHCIYGREAIADARKRTNEAASYTLQQRTAELRPLTLEEETVLLRHYQLKIPEICRFFRFPRRVVTTAHWILARVSLKHSAMQHDPKHTMLACVLLASKLEDLHLTMDQYAGRIPKTDRDLLMRLEFVLLAALEYRLFFFSPHPPLLGIMMELIISHPALKTAIDDAAIEAALDCLERICTTDAILMYTPTRLAAIAVAMTLGSDLTRAYFADLAAHNSNNSIGGLEESVVVVEGLLAGLEPDPETVRAIDRQLIQMRRTLDSLDKKQWASPVRD